MHKTDKHATKIETFADTDIDAWDSRALGQDELYVERVDASFESSLDNAVNLQMISIRLQKSLIEDLKLIAKANGVGYQPLIRDVLTRFAHCEIKQIIKDTLKRREEEEKKRLEAEKESAQNNHEKKAA
jgi:predicted DNA binding CopG/RHH family protein